MGRLFCSSGSPNPPTRFRCLFVFPSLFFSGMEVSLIFMQWWLFAISVAWKSSIFKLCLGPSKVLTANVMQDFACGLLSCEKEALTQFWTTTLLITCCQLIVAILSSLGRQWEIWYPMEIGGRWIFFFFSSYFPFSVLFNSNQMLLVELVTSNLLGQIPKINKTQTALCWSSAVLGNKLEGRMLLQKRPVK